MKSPKKIALLGFDCAITSMVRKHIAEGLCPNFERVMNQGVVAENCLCPFPTVTPPNWTVMATGAWPGTNGITDFHRHLPGTSPSNENSHNSFNWDYVKSESFWEAAEKAGKRSIIFNYPSSFNIHKKLKNCIQVAGASTVPGVIMDQLLVSEITGKPFDNKSYNHYTFSDDIMISTDMYPGTLVRVNYVKASGWENIDNLGINPLECTLEIPFADSVFETKSATWYLLVRELGKDGYDTVSLSPTKNFKDAFFTLNVGEWSKAFNSEGLLANNGSKTLRMIAKLISMNDEGEDLRLFVSHGLNLDGEHWCYPQEQAKLLNKGNNVCTNNAGMFILGSGWIDLDTWLELIEIHYDWLADGIEALLKNNEWDIFYSHAHPTDYVYHVLMTDLIEDTASSPAAHKKAWELHRKLFIAADRYLGRLMELMDDDTLVTLISDHGASPDGPFINMVNVLEQAGLTALVKSEMPEFIKNMPENLHEVVSSQYIQVDLSKSKALPQRQIFVYVNLKGRDPGGIVEPEDYEKTQREIVDALMTYVEPKTGKRPFSMALPKKEAMMIGLWGEQCGDVVFALWPEFGSQHGHILPGSEYGLASLKPLCVFYGPKLGIKQGYSMTRVCNLVDLVPTYCYMTGWPIPKDAEGAVIYQIMENPNEHVVSLV